MKTTYKGLRALTPAERLIVSADFSPHTTTQEIRGEVLKLADLLSNTGVCIKINSALRSCGYSLISEIKARNLRVFADLKLYDIGTTLIADANFLQDMEPDMLTISAHVNMTWLVPMLKIELPRTEILGVTVLTETTHRECFSIYNRSVDMAVAALARRASEGGLHGIVCSPMEASRARSYIKKSMSINTPAVRPLWSTLKDDNQNSRRIDTPQGAIQKGANRIIVGRPIIESVDRYGAVMRTIDEIASALS
ncbi:MAG: orotidine 5-phosphate decarboxylase [Candidatus Parcubacteria bacterium]|nr:orotidine 5-phosphate decarboxylase [Candidatus Parcubacteria bacterium]